MIYESYGMFIAKHKGIECKQTSDVYILEGNKQINILQIQNILTEYSFDHQISKRSSNQVWIAKRKKDKMKVIIKIIKTFQIKKNESFHLFHYEKALINLRSNNFINMFQIINSEKFKFIVMEYACKGDLSSQIIAPTSLLQSNKRNLYYSWAKKIFYEISLALKQVHRMGYVLRDLKPQNILINHQGKLKLTDFGLAVPQGTVDESFCGTISYMGPERLNTSLLKQKIDYSVDIWSLGITAYQLFFGGLPYLSQSPSELLSDIYQYSILFPAQFSQTGKQLIRSLLCPNPKKRPKITQIINHPFFNDITTEQISLLNNCQCFSC